MDNRYQPPRATTSDERNEMAQILHDLQHLITLCVGHMMESGPAAESVVQAEADLAGSLAETGYTDVFTGLAAATQHLEALGRVLRKGGPLGAPTLALTRSSIESAGRAWFLLDASEGTLNERAAALTFAELKHASADFSLYSGKDDSRASLDEVRARLDADRGNVRPPSFTRIAKNLIVAAGFLRADEAYSRLSGGAHGEAVTVHGLRVAGSDDERFVSIGLPTPDARMIILLAVWTATTVMDRLVADFSTTADADQWAAGRDRVHARTRELGNKLVPTASA